MITMMHEMVTITIATTILLRIGHIIGKTALTVGSLDRCVYEH